MPIKFFLITVFLIFQSGCSDYKNPFNNPSENKAKNDNSDNDNSDNDDSDSDDSKVITCDKKGTDHHNFLCEIEIHIKDLTNDIRQKHSVSNNLKFHPEVSHISRDWSYQQYKDGTISHDGFPKERTSLFKKLFPEVKMPSMRGENVAMRSRVSDSKDAKKVALGFVKMWENSSGHLRNMINKNHKWIGAGVYFDEKNGRGIYATQIFGQ